MPLPLPALKRYPDYKPSGVEWLGDDCAFTMLLDDDIRGRLQERGDDPVQLLDTYIQAINLAIQERPEGVVIATHLCRGNNRGYWLASGGYDKVAEKLFTQLQVDAFFLEYDSSRAGTFEPLRFMPRDKKVVLGLTCPLQLLHPALNNSS